MIRSIGFPQNPSEIGKLKVLAGMFIPGLPENIAVIENIEWLLHHEIKHGSTFYDAVDPALADSVKMLKEGSARIKYADLKGKGVGKRPGRPAAACSGLVQAAIEAQSIVTFRDKKTSAIVTRKKPYSDDWTADGFLRWAISIGILDYDDGTDTCGLTVLGEQVAHASCTDFNALIGGALLKYPPVSRILSLLENTNGIKSGSADDPLWTKFKLGGNLGFIGEAGFTSMAENLWLAEYNTATSRDERKQIKANREGTMDKHARMICSWLKQIGWVKSSTQTVAGIFGGTVYSAEMECYYITVQGAKAYKNSLGGSSRAKVQKIVYLGTLATKSPDSDYLCAKRATIINSLSKTTTGKTLDTIKRELQSAGFSENESTIKDDIQGLIRIGIRITEKSGRFRLEDKVDTLEVPGFLHSDPTDVMGTVNKLRGVLKTVDHKYLGLISCSVNSKKYRDFESGTMELLTNELGFNGKYLGGSNRPDGIVSEQCTGLIIDTKAYAGGYNLPRAQKDEMFRYISDFIFKDKTVNPTKWWELFPTEVAEVFFSFISSSFKNTVKRGIGDISRRTIKINNNKPIKGGCITVQALLEKAEDVKSGRMSRQDFVALFSKNEIYQDI